MLAFHEGGSLAGNESSSVASRSSSVRRLPADAGGDRSVSATGRGIATCLKSPCNRVITFCLLPQTEAKGDPVSATAKCPEIPRKTPTPRGRRPSRVFQGAALLSE